MSHLVIARARHCEGFAHSKPEKYVNRFALDKALAMTNTSFTFLFLIFVKNNKKQDKNKMEFRIMK